MASPTAPTPLVLLHGFTNTAASWDPVVAALGRDHPSIALDLRGHGSASARRPVTLDAVVGDLADRSPDRFALVGYSMGGRVALHAALALGPRIERLALIGASPGLRDAEQRAERRAADDALATAIEAGTIEEFVSRWAQTPVLADQPAAVRAAVSADRLRNTTDGLAAALRGLGTGALGSLWPRLGELTLPVALIVGERDAKFRATARRMADALPDARLRVVAGAGHAVHLEDPASVARIIARAD